MKNSKKTLLALSAISLTVSAETKNIESSNTDFKIVTSPKVIAAAGTVTEGIIQRLLNQIQNSTAQERQIAANQIRTNIGEFLGNRLNLTFRQRACIDMFWHSSADTQAFLEEIAENIEQGATFSSVTVNGNPNVGDPNVKPTAKTIKGGSVTAGVNGGGGQPPSFNAGVVLNF